MVKANELYEKAMKEFMTSAKEAKSDQDSEWEFKIEREGGREAELLIYKHVKLSKNK